MSESIRRRSSSRQLLQNLIRMTAQRSQEDAEEVARERRRRSREEETRQGRPPGPDPPQFSDSPRHTQLEEELTARCVLVLEEDEGFSDWSHRLESRTKRDVPDDCSAGVQRHPAPRWNREHAEEKQEDEEEEEKGCGEASGRFLEGSPPPQEEVQQLNAVGTGRVEQEEQTGEEEEEEEEVHPALQMEWRPVETQWSPRDEDNQEEEELSFTREEEAHTEEEQEEEHKILNKSASEDRRREEVGRRPSRSFSSSSSGDESLNCYGPMSPTFKKLLVQFYPDEANSRVSEGKCSILKRAESLRKSTTSVKKTPLPVSKIDKKLEQYTHALEVKTHLTAGRRLVGFVFLRTTRVSVFSQASSKEGRSGCHPPADLMSAAEPVSSKRTLFEARDAWSQSPVSGAPSKDADGLKVGVADLINQWVKGSEDGSRCSSPREPADGSSGKRFRFVVTSHGKYEKVSGGGGEDANSQADGRFCEDF
ncbi:lymphocyte-specific protein 1-like [Brachionichthys hirsutus]|uniref:lymphocyte-specific protein 1-like n=1 Tax=Brachionichthys hirsutus TaxID=412623 RepID=UPI0036047F87